MLADTNYARPIGCWENMEKEDLIVNDCLQCIFND